MNINNKRKDIDNIVFNFDFSGKKHLFSENDNKCKIFYNVNKNINKYKQNNIHFDKNLEKEILSQKKKLNIIKIIQKIV